MPQRLNPPSIRPVGNDFKGIYTHAVALEAPQKLFFISGQIGVDPQGVTHESFEDQCHEAMASVETLLSAVDLSMNDMLRVVYYLTKAENLPALTKIRQARWGGSEAPAVTTLVIAALARPEYLVEIEVTAGR